MQSSEGVGGLLNDKHLLDKLVRPTSSTPYRSKATVTRPTRPVSAPPSRPLWRNTGSPEPKRSRKFHLSLNHSPLESRTSKKAPYAARKTIGGSTALGGREFSPTVYNSLSDPHLNEYFSRKFGYTDNLQVSGTARPCRTRRSAAGTKKKVNGILYKVLVRTGEKRNAGTDAKVFVEFRGSIGKFRRQLTHQVEAGVPSAFVATLPPFQFTPGCKETFNIKGPDVGDMRQLTVEHDGKDRKQGWFLEEIDVTHSKTGQRWIFPCHQWLSLYESDCQTCRNLKPVEFKKAAKIVYVVEVDTGDKAGAGTDAHVFITMFGRHGHTPKTQLINRSVDTFERKKKDSFKIKTKALGPLTKLIIEHDNFGFSAGWFLDKITVYDREVPDKKYYFPCNQWLAKDEGDHQIVRQLTATTDPGAGYQGYVYLVSTYTGDKRGAGTDANVAITIFGEDGDSREQKLDNARNNFERAKKDTFKVNCGTYLGALTKVRIGHDNSGLGPGWFLEKVAVEDPKTKEVVEFSCRRWMSKSEDDGKLSRELVREGGKEGDMTLDAAIPYHIHVTTGDMRNASTDARVYVILHGGEEGEENSGKVWLENDKKDNFNRGRTDIFTVETTTMLSPLHHLRIGHDNAGLGVGYYCEKVVVDCPSSGHQQVFLCRKWLADDEDDGLIERDLYESEDMRLKRRPKVIWNVWVWTSDIRGAGTDADVFVTLYGNKGKTEETQIGNATDNFEQGELDKFKIEMVKVGKPYKLRIRHDNSKPFPDWHLEKMQIQSASTNCKYTFKCGRWLSLSEDDHQIIREMPAVGDGTEDLPVYTYHVFVHTGDKRGAGTDANVFITIFGGLGDTGERPLKESQTSKNKFERKQVDEFLVEAVTLRELKMVRIGHDGQGGGAAWYLDKVVIRDPEDSTREYDFPCDRWLAKDEDDGAIVRELSLGGTSLLNTTSYHLSVRTGDVRGAATDANVYAIINGENGDTGILQLRQAQNTKNKFERGRTDKFILEAVDIGKVQMLRIGHDNSKPGAGWFLEDAILDIPSRGDHVVFPCHRWLADDEDDSKTERDLFPGDYQESNPKIPYEVTVYTGDIRGAGTNSNVFLILYGEKGKSDEFQLRNKSDNFERAQVDKFKVECEDVGPLTKIRIGHNDSGFGSAWFLDKVEIKRMKEEESKRSKPKKRGSKRDSEEQENAESEHDYLFVCNRWLAKDEDDGQVVRELVPMDATGTKRRGSSLAENTYRVHVYTGDVSGAGSNSNVFFTLYGEHGDSGERKLDKSETHLDKFERDNEDIFSLVCVNLGSMTKAKIRHDNSGLKSAWYLDRVEVKDKLAGTTAVFPCSRWLATSEDDGQICRELVPVDGEAFKQERQRSMRRKQSMGRKDSQVSLVDGVELEHKARTTTYEVSVATGDVRGAGTDANVYIIMYGDNEDTGKIPLKTSQTNKNKFERAQTDVFPVDANVGEVRKIRIGHDNKGGFAGWFVDSVTVDVPSLGQRAVFPCGRWFDKDKDDGLMERELVPTDDNKKAYRPHVPYEITVYTSDVSGAGTSANVFIALYGLDCNTEDVVLADTSKKKKCTFNRGAVDQFVKELDDVGDAIEKIRIGHDNKGIGAGWHLEKVEIRRLLDGDGSSATSTFLCNRWFAKGEDDGAVVRELVPHKVVEDTITEDGKVQSKEVEQVTLDMRKYKVHVFTGDVKSAGTDANVYMTIFGEYGDSGERQLTKSSTYTDKFERGHEDIFTLEAADLGNLYKIKLRHDNSKLSPSWFVDRVEIRDMEMDRMYPFIVERWLAKGKEDKKIERSIYVKGFEGDRSTLGTMSTRSLGRESPRGSSPRGSPQVSRKGSILGSRNSLHRSNDSLASHVSRSSTADAVFVKEYGDNGKKEPAANRQTIPYTIRVATGDQSDAGTEAKAYAVLIGEEAVTEKIPLELVQKEGFTPGLTETFSIEAVDVGKVQKLEIGHNGHVPAAGWFVKDIEVDVPTMGAKYFFPCGRWLSQDKEDGKTIRILSASNDQMVTYKPHVAYEMEIYTGDVKAAGTDSRVFMTLYGSGGATPEVTLEKDESRFERAGVDVIRMELEDVGKLLKMRIGIDGRGSRPSWHLDKIIMRNLDKGNVILFKCNQWFSADKDGGKLVRDLACETEGGEKEALQKTTYKVTVKTGDVSGAGTDANVFMTIFGETGDSGEMALKNSETFKDKFERKHDDVFIFKNIYSLGQLSKVRIWHDNKFLGADWFLESVEVVDESSGKTYEFPCHRWLSKDKDDKSLVRELPCANRVEKIEEKGSTVYDVTLLTSDKQQAGTTQNAWLVFEGEEGASREMTIENSAKNKVLRRGNTDSFKFKSKPIGPLTFVTVGHRKREGAPVKGTGKETSWFLHEVIVTNESYGKFVFPCRQWIPLSSSRRDAVRLECKSTEKPRVAALRELQPVQYLVEVRTADVKHAGTDANVFITIYGANGDSGKRPLTKKFVDLFERGKTDDFKLEVLDLGQLTRLRVEHDNKGFGAGWMLEQIDITNSASQEKTIFRCNQWLDKKKGDGKICRDLFPLPTS